MSSTTAPVPPTPTCAACVLLETSMGDLVIDLDCDGSPRLAQNFLKLVKARYYTQNLVHTVVLPGRFLITGDATGTGTGGASIFALLEYDKSITNNSNNDNNKDREVALRKSAHRFLKSTGQRRLSREECREKGRVLAVELNGVTDTVGSQFLITTASGENRALDGYSFAKDDDETQEFSSFLSLGRVAEDESNILDRMATDTTMYCDDNGRPFADVRILRALIVHDPFDDPPGMPGLLKHQGVVVDDETVLRSPSPERPEQEEVPVRIPYEQMLEETIQDDPEREHARMEEVARQADRSRAVVLEMLGDLPSADITAPENVLFVCKLNAITTDEDLELIFSRFDPLVKVEIIRDYDTGQSLQYAFCEFSTKEQAAQAYFKMDNALVDDRRIKVDFSQSVAKMWDRYNQRIRRPAGAGRPGGGGGRGGRGGHGGNGGWDGGRGNRGRAAGPRQSQQHQHQQQQPYHQQRRGPPQNSGPRPPDRRYNQTGNNDRQRFARDNQNSQQNRGEGDGRDILAMDRHRMEMPERRRDDESNIRGARENKHQGSRERLDERRERGSGESYHGGSRDGRNSSSRDNRGKERTGEHRRDERRTSRRHGREISLDSRGHAKRPKEHTDDRRSRNDESPKDHQSRREERKRGHEDVHSNDDSSRSERRSKRKHPRDDRSSDDDDDDDSARRRKKKHKHKEGRHKERSHHRHKDRHHGGHESRRHRRRADNDYDKVDRPRKRDDPDDRERKRRHRSPMQDGNHDNDNHDDDKDRESSRKRHRDDKHHSTSKSSHSKSK